MVDDKSKWPLGEIPNTIMKLLEKFAEYKAHWLRTRMRHQADGGVFPHHLAEIIEKWKSGSKSEKMNLIKNFHDPNHSYHQNWIDYWTDVSDYPEKARNLVQLVEELLTEELKDLVDEFGDGEITPNLMDNWLQEPNYMDLVKDDDGHYKNELQEILVRSGFSDGTDQASEKLRQKMGRLRQFRNVYQHGKENSTGINFNQTYIELVPGVIENIILFEEQDEEEVSNFFIEILDFLSGTRRTWSDISQPNLLEHHLTLIPSRQFSLESRAKSVARRLALHEWDTYVEPKCENEFEEEVFATELIEENLKEHLVVQIHGLGGLGKTALVYAFIKKNLDPNVSNLPSFESIVTLTSKGAEQGELIEERWRAAKEGPIANPQDPKINTMEYIPGLEFGQFISRICSLSDTPKSGEKAAIEILSKKRHLVILDNYEDVSGDDKKRYKKFFKNLNKKSRSESQVESRLIITTRPNEELPYGKIALGHLPPELANDLLVERYIYYSRKYGHPIWSTEAYHLNTLLSYRDNGIDIIEKIRKLLPKDKQNSFSRSSSHPKILFNLVSLIGDIDLREKYGLDRTLPIEEYIAKIASLPDSPFFKYHEETYEWIIKKAYQDLTEDKYCVFLLKTLAKMAPKGSDHNELEGKAEEHFDEVDAEDINISLTKLRKAGVFVEIKRPDPSTLRYYLQPDAHKFLGTQLKNDDPVTEMTPTEVGTIASQEDLQLIVEILDEVKKESKTAESINRAIDKLISQDIPLRRRDVVSIQTLNLGLAILETSTKLNSEMQEETDANMRLLRHEIRETGQRILNHKNPDDLIVEGTPSQVAAILIQLLRFEKTRSEEVQTLVAVANTLAPVSWVDIGDSHRLILVNIISTQDSLKVSFEDTDDYIISWIRLCSHLHKTGYFTADQTGIYIIERLLHLYDKHESFVTLVDERLKAPERLDFSAMIEELSPACSWQRNKYDFCSEFDTNNSISRFTWNSFLEKPPATQWRRFDTTPKLTKSSLIDAEFNVVVQDEDGSILFKGNQVKDNESHKCAFDEYHHHTNTVYVRLIETNEYGEISSEYRTVPEDVSNWFQRKIQELAKQDPMGKGIVYNHHLGEEFKQFVGESSTQYFSDTEYKKLRIYVEAVIIPLFQGRLKVNEEEENKSHHSYTLEYIQSDSVPTPFAPGASSLSLKMDIDRDLLIKEGMEWITESKKGHPGFPESSKICIDVLRDISSLFKDTSFSMDSQLNQLIKTSPSIMGFADYLKNQIRIKRGIPEDYYRQEHRQVMSLVWISGYRIAKLYHPSSNVSINASVPALLQHCRDECIRCLNNSGKSATHRQSYMISISNWVEEIKKEFSTEEVGLLKIYQSYKINQQKNRLDHKNRQQDEATAERKRQKEIRKKARRREMLRKKQQREAAQKALEEKEAKAAEEYAQWAWEQEQISIKQRQKWRAEEERQQLIDSIKRKYGNPLAQVMINSTRMVIKHTDRSQGRKIKDDFAIYFKRFRIQSILTWARPWPNYTKWIDHVDQLLTDEKRSNILASD